MAVLRLLLLSTLLVRVGGNHIITHGDTTAEYGGDAYYGCTLQNSTDVLQVTWQKLSEDGSLENLATYSKEHGPHVNNPYQKTLTLAHSSHRSSSIALSNITWTDEGCYICTFNIHPNGSQRQQICLSVQGLSRIRTDAKVLDSTSSKGLVRIMFSCSATGKPPPVIQWLFFPLVKASNDTAVTTLMNTDHTFTSKGNLTLTVSVDYDEDVYCLVTWGKEGRKAQKILFSLTTGYAPNTTVASPTTYKSIAAGVTTVVLLSFLIVLMYHLKRDGLTELCRPQIPNLAERVMVTQAPACPQQIGRLSTNHQSQWSSAMERDVFELLPLP